MHEKRHFLSGMDLYYAGLPDVRYALETLFSFFFFPTYCGLFGRATCGVSIWNGGLTELTVSVHYLHHADVKQLCTEISLFTDNIVIKLTFVANFGFIHKI